MASNGVDLPVAFAARLPGVRVLLPRGTVQQIEAQATWGQVPAQSSASAMAGSQRLSHAPPSSKSFAASGTALLAAVAAGQARSRRWSGLRAMKTCSGSRATALRAVPEIEAVDEPFMAESEAPKKALPEDASADMAQATSDSLLAAAEDFTGALVSSKERWNRPGLPRGFKPGVLVSSDGEEIGGGDGARLEGSQELIEWLTGRGCVGLDKIVMKDGGGVFLRKDAGAIKGEEDVFTIPKSVWFMGPEEAPASLEAFAWKLLQEVWAGTESEFEPFLTLLRNRDMEHHPMNWQDDEVAWLQPSPEAYEEVNKLRDQTVLLLAKLNARLLDDPEQPALPSVTRRPMPSNLLSDKDALQAELRWALAIIQAYAIEMQDEDDSEATFLALCPLMIDVRNMSVSEKHDDRACVDFDGYPDSLNLVAMRSLRPGEELRQRSMPGASSAELLVTMGIVPGAESQGVPKDQQLLDLNADLRVMLQVPPVNLSDFPGNTHIAIKMKFLDEFAGLDLRAPRLEGAPVARTSFTLPDDSLGSGRLLPTARFMCSQFNATGKQLEIKEETRILFNHCFEHCDLDVNPSSASDKRPILEYSLDVEVMARKLAADWCTAAINQCGAYIEAVAEATGLPTGSKDGLITVGIGHTVMTHFKAKHKDGSTGKSRKPRQARVVSVQEETMTVRVEFSGNSKRHEVPADWIVEAQPAKVAGLLASGCTPARVQRGKLAITLLRTERSALFYHFDAFSKSAATMQGLDDHHKALRQSDDMIGANKCIELIDKFMNDEDKEIDDNMIALMSGSMDTLPQLTDEGLPAPRGSDKPVWGLPKLDSTEQLENWGINDAEDLASKAAASEKGFSSSGD